MKVRRLMAAAAMIAAGSLLLGACGTGGTPPAEPEIGVGDDAGTDGAGDRDEDSDTDGDQTLTIGWNQPFFEYNAHTATGDAVANSVVLHLVQSRFHSYDAGLALVPDPSFGTQEVLSEDPLRIRYTFAETARWSDGVPVDAADLVMFWGAKNPRFNTVAPDEETGEIDEVEEEAGVYFNAVDAAVGLIEDFPEVSWDNKAVTFTYNEPYADWETLLDVGVPAHVVAMHALNISDPLEAKQVLMDAFENDDEEMLAAISTFWNEGFRFSAILPADESLYLSSGPYEIVELRGNQHLTLERNPDYRGRNNVSIDSITIKYFDSSDTLVQALAEGEVDVISPQATPDTLISLDRLGDEFTILTGQERSFEHIDLVFDNGGPFDAATYDDEEVALKVRRAFLKLIPREEIVNKLLRPLDPEATVRNSFTAIPGTPMYEGIVEANGMSEYDEPDVDGAKELIDEVGLDTPIDVRLMFGAGNERRANAFALMKEVMDDSGLFNLIDSSREDWSSILPEARDQHDALLFAWAAGSTAVTPHERTYATGGENNFGHYSNAEVDDWFTELRSTPGPAEQEELLKRIENQLVADAFGLPLWQFPAVTAYNSRVQNMEPIPLIPTLFHGFWNWEFTD